MKGKIIKGIAGFYYVHVEGRGIYECKAKGIFRNRIFRIFKGIFSDVRNQNSGMTMGHEG